MNEASAQAACRRQRVARWIALLFVGPWVTAAMADDTVFERVHGDGAIELTNVPDSDHHYQPVVAADKEATRPIAAAGDSHAPGIGTASAVEPDESAVANAAKHARSANDRLRALYDAARTARETQAR